MMTNRERFVRRFLREKASNAYLRQGPWYLEYVTNQNSPRQQRLTCGYVVKRVIWCHVEWSTFQFNTVIYRRFETGTVDLTWRVNDGDMDLGD